MSIPTDTISYIVGLKTIVQHKLYTVIQYNYTPRLKRNIKYKLHKVI